MFSKYFSGIAHRIRKYIIWKFFEFKGALCRDDYIKLYNELIQSSIDTGINASNFHDFKGCQEEWMESLALEDSNLGKGWPTMPFAGIKFLERVLNRKSLIFQYGANGTTIFLINFAKELISVSDCNNEVNSIREIFHQKYKFKNKWNGVVINTKRSIPEKKWGLNFSDPLSYLSANSEDADATFYEYARFIDKYPNQYFDLIYIDSKAVPSCFMHAISKVKIGGWIAVVNAQMLGEESWIEEATYKFGFEKTEFWGPTAGKREISRTIFIRKIFKYYGLNELDKRIEKYLDFNDGVFIEAGGNDGIRQSNTIYFELYKNWRGILVEPIKERYEEARRVRPSAKHYNLALVEKGAGFENVKLIYGDLMTHLASSFKTNAERAEHLRQAVAVQKLNSSYEFIVPCKTLSEVIDDSRINTIDLLSLDVEGYEKNVLMGIDFDRHAPKFILVEIRYIDDVLEVLLPRYKVLEKFDKDILLKLIN